MDFGRYVYNCKVVCGMFVLFLWASCNGVQEDRPKEGNASDGNSVMTTAAAKGVLSYWDDFNFKAQTLAMSPDVVEQKFVDFLALFPTVPDTVVHVAVYGMLEKAAKEPAIFSYFLEKYNHYLYDPNSPMRNEGYYEQVLAYLAEDNMTPAHERSKYVTMLELVRKNKVGTTAANFRYLAKDGKHHMMHEGNKPYKMLVFYDPTCTHCAAIMSDLAQTPAVRNCITNGFLEIVSVSLLPNKDQWIAYQRQIPDNWINGWDEEGHVINDGLYNIRAYPTIFLLDKENKILLKDAPLDKTLRLLVNLVSR